MENVDLSYESGAVEAYSKAFLVYSLYGWIELWFQRGRRESAEEIGQLFMGVGVPK